MLRLRKSSQRGQANHGWLQTRFSFSFADYYDPQHMGVSALRVINDDIIAAGTGFDTHPHRDMEIITYIIEGQIEHKDTMGFHTVLRRGDVQVMSAGSGILHSEHNPSADNRLKLLQIWIQPNTKNAKPRYAQHNFADSQGITLIVSPDGREQSLPIRQDACIYKLQRESGSLEHSLNPERSYYLHLVSGDLTLDGTTLSPGDGVTVQNQSSITLANETPVEALLFDLP